MPFKNLTLLNETVFILLDEATAANHPCFNA